MENALIQQDLGDVQEKDSFKIENLEGATWAFRKLRAIASKEKEIEEIATMERERINIWELKQKEEFESNKTYFEMLLNNYYREEKSKDKKFKLSTPYGKVSSRRTQKWFYEDEQALKEYIKANNIPAIKIKEEIDKISLKKLFRNGVNKETGEVLPGVQIEEIETVTVKAE